MQRNETRADNVEFNRQRDKTLTTFHDTNFNSNSTMICLNCWAWTKKTVNEWSSPVACKIFCWERNVDQTTVDCLNYCEEIELIIRCISHSKLFGSRWNTTIIHRSSWSDKYTPEPCEFLTSIDTVKLLEILQIWKYVLNKRFLSEKFW